MTKLFRDLFVVYILSLVLPSLLFAADPARDPFYGMGHELSGNRTFDQIAEYVDPFSGYVTISNTDVVLPGNDGLDVRITRSYNSAIWGRKDVSYPGFMVWNDWSPLGIGWSMHMGIVRNPAGGGSSSYYFPNNPVVEMPDGSQHVLYKDKNNSSQYITREYWLYKSVGSGMWELTLTDGTVYTFQYNPTGNVGYIDRAGVNVAQVTSIKNPSRTSSVTINYQRGANGYSYLSNIADSLSRNINFNYDFTNHRLTSITVDSRTFTYSYQTINTGPIFGTQNFLTQVTPPAGSGSPWKYDYNAAPNTFDLQKITFPAGGSITYSYGNESFDTGISDVSFRVVTQRATGGSNSNGTIPAGTWTYSYSTGGSLGNITTITGPSGLSEIHTFNAWGNNCPSAGPCGSIWKIGLPLSKEVRMNGSQILNESYTWTKGTEISRDYISNGDWNSAGIFIYDTVYTPFLSSRSITRDNATYTTNYSIFDTYGNPKNISETGDKTRTTSVDYYWTNATGNIVKGKPHTQTVTGGFPGSFSTTYTYDNSSGHVTQMTKYGITTNYHYFSNGNLDYVTDANGKTTYYQWSNGRISQIQPPETGTTINRVINSSGTIASETNARNYTTSFTYDGILRLASVDPPTGNTTTYTYGADNSYKKETRGGFYTYYYYDGFGRPVGTSDSKGITTDIEYKSYEVKDYSTSNIGDRANFDYFGRPISIVHQDNTSIGYAYSGSDVTVTDEALHTTHLYYSAFGNPDEKLLESVTDTNNLSTAYNYNILGSLTNATLGGSSLGTFSYDATKNFLTSESTPEKGSIIYGRDLVGNMTSKQDALGTVSYDYDNNYRLKTITYGSNSVTFGYDGSNNRTSMDSPGASIDYTYDASNRLTIKSETIATRPYTTNFGYDGNDNLTSITYPSHRIVTYGYNANNQVVSVTGFGGSVSSVNYCSTAPCIGLPSSFTTSSGKTTSFSYTPRNLTSHITTGSSVSNTEYEYADNRGNMTSLTDHINVSPSRNQSMTYDNLNRLSTFSGAWGSGSFTYLANGDRSRKTVAGVNTDYWYSNNRLTSTTGGEADTFSYNNHGDLISLNGVSLTIDRLHNVTSYNGTPVVSFAYDGDGMRVSKSVGGNTVFYHYDKEGRLLSEDGGNGVLIADYIYLNGKLAAKVVNTFTVTASTGPNGSLDGSTTSPQTANYNGTTSFKFNADIGYHILGVSGCGGTIYNNTDNAVSSYTYTTGAITADCTVSATFTINQYKVTPSVSADGYFSPSTQQTVNYNGTASFTIYPNSGYHIISISGCGGITVGPQSTNASAPYTTGQITGDCVVTAIFSNTFSVTASAGANGSLDTTYRTSPQAVNYNGTTSFRFSASTGYHVSSVSGCGGTAYNNTSNNVTSYTYTTGAISVDCTVAANFAINTYTVTASAGANGSLDISYRTSPQTVNYNGTTSFKFNAAANYHVSGVSGCGGTVYNNTSNALTSYTYTTGAVTADCTVNASFSLNQYQVTALPGANGSLDGAYTSPQTINYAGTTSFKFNAATGYHISSVSGCGGITYSNNSMAITSYTYTTGTIVDNCTVSAAFSINQYQVAASAGANGSLDAAYISPQTINYNGTTSFKFNAAPGYHVENVSGCWGTTYSNSSHTVATYIYTTGPVTGDCTVTVTFATNQYTVEASAGLNGSLDSAYISPQTIPHNGTTSFKFNADPNYHIGGVSGCGGTDYINTLPAITSYTYSTGLITDDCTVTAIFVINPPAAGFTFIVTPISGEVPLKVQFTDSSTLSPTAWLWDFGDTSYSTEQNPVHVFETYGTGTYTVKLTATNAGGSSNPVAHAISVSVCSNAHSIKLLSSGSPYDSIAAAYTNAIDGDTIQSKAIHFIDNLTVDKNITLDGGYDCQISQKIGNTTIKGATDPAITITTGSVTFEGISIE